MRLLIALPDSGKAYCICNEMESMMWDVTVAADGKDALHLLKAGSFDLLLLHRCLPEIDGLQIGRWLEEYRLICPPRILLTGPMEYGTARPSWADAVTDAGTDAENLCRLLLILSQKPLPKLAAVQTAFLAESVEHFLDAVAMNRRCKGRAYAAWLIRHVVPSPLLEERPIGELYARCAAAFHVRPEAVERCVRIAVEGVFTQGSLQGIERFFGATIDPEKGKPTNRAFLYQAAAQLRLSHSRAEALSPNRSVMHHSPAAPTSV